MKQHDLLTRVSALIIAVVGTVFVTTHAAIAVQQIIRFSDSGNYIGVMFSMFGFLGVIGTAMWFIYHGFLRIVERDMEGK